MRAIETEYNGVLFRSRLEARWAVFFDGIKARWKYEPEGYELADGTRYLPDFWLPLPYAIGRGLFLEIKPEGDDLTKADAFAREQEHSVLGVTGEPSDCRLWVLGVRGCELLSPAFYFVCRFANLPEHELTQEIAKTASMTASTYRFWNPQERR